MKKRNSTANPAHFHQNCPCIFDTCPNKIRTVENDENAIFFSEKDGNFYFGRLYFVGALVNYSLILLIQPCLSFQ